MSSGRPRTRRAVGESQAASVHEMGSVQLPLLSRKHLESLEHQTTADAELPPPSLMSAPETILQFGTGNFVRGFVEDFVQLANASGDLSGRVVAVQRRPDHRSETFAKQDGLYTLILRGIEAGRKVEVKRVIASVSRLLISETQWDQVMSVAANSLTSVIVSNVTETGLALDPSDQPGLMPPRGFPGKLTQLLLARWQATLGQEADVAVIPCELVENNGPLLRRLVLDQARAWNVVGEFTRWVETSVHFASTLVDRIVVGTPRQELLQSEWEALGYRDDMINCAEPFYLFAIEADPFTRRHFALDRASPNVRYVEDLTPYRVRKLRLLNGPHTVLSSLGRLMGLHTVRGAIEDDQLGKFIQQMMFDEIAPALGSRHEEEGAQYARAILDRFRNPTIEHKLLSICVNCTTKAGIRLFPSLRNYSERFGRLPDKLLLGLAAVLAVVRQPQVEDSHSDFFRERWRDVDTDSRDSLLAFVQNALASQAGWTGEQIDVQAVAGPVSELLQEIIQSDVRTVLARRWNCIGFPLSRE